MRMTAYSDHESTLVHVRIEGSRSGHKPKLWQPLASGTGSPFDSQGQNDDCMKVCTEESVRSCYRLRPAAAWSDENCFAFYGDSGLYVFVQT